MNTQTWTAKRFFTSEYFAEGLRSTLAVLLPVLAFAQLGQLAVGIPVSIGALAASLADVPGPVVHKRNGLLICTVVVFFVSLLTGFALSHVFLMGTMILAGCFFLSMLTVYGNRAAMVGTAGLLVLVLVLGMAPKNVWAFSGLLAAGGIWYLLLSMAFSRLLPFRPAQHALGECIRETAAFLKLKADFYSPSTSLDENYRNVIKQQTVVSDKQDAVRELLLRGRAQDREAADRTSVLVLTFVDVVDLYEQMAAIQYDYATMRRAFGQSGILEHIGNVVRLVAEELNEIGWAIQSGSRFRRRQSLPAELAQLERRMKEVAAGGDQNSGAVLEKIYANLQQMLQRIEAIQRYFTSGTPVATAKNDELEYARFVTRQGYDLKLFRENLTPTSTTFRHALRVALACLFGYILTKSIPLGLHSYWVLLTIIVILKPAFSFTKQRNYQRLVGTLIGGVLGVVVLAVVQDKGAQLVLLSLFMLGTFSTQRISYVVSVVLMTPFILIGFDFLGGEGLLIAQERIVDTLLGSAIAFAASYLLFPNWESEKLSDLMQRMLRANSSYLQKLAASVAGAEVGTIEYKLARKEVYVSSANLSAAFRRMVSEPKRKQHDVEGLHSFLVLNHILSSTIAAASSALLARPHLAYPEAYRQPVRQAEAVLQESLLLLRKEKAAPAPEILRPANHSAADMKEEEDVLLLEQLEFIWKISQDICKTTKAIYA
ncbi:FUSC family protein [Pontibacter russatus]|uniref:FUSC family protein n=1 Tax=Pontibacter russatus TaxID=2694929 RepID=UPI00137B622F|nr:FUSC family membrane protein [Pontibacter russatus]